MSKNNHFEYIVLGDGAGATLARNIAKYGHKTALIGHGRPGGTCLNRGCIPSKKLILPIFKIHESIKTLQKYDSKFSSQVSKFLDFKTLRHIVEKEVEGYSMSSKNNMESGKISNLTYYSSHTKFVDNKTLILESGEKITFDTLILATGSNPRIAKEIKGIENIDYHTSTEALFNSEDIDEYTIIGGGVIACELGALYAASGIKVKIIALRNILRPIDDCLKEDVEKYLKNLGIEIDKNLKINEIIQKDGIKTIKYTDCNDTFRTHKAKHLLIAMGVSPNTSDINIENTKIELNKYGFVQTDSNYKACKNIYAIGDCAGKNMLRHGAGFEGRELFKHLILKEKKVLDQSYMPAGIYLGSSEVASCGKSSQQLLKQNIEFETYQKTYEDTISGKAKGYTGRILIHYDPKTLKIFGSHIFGPDAVNINQIIVPYIEHHKTLFDLSNTICPHPCVAEGLITIGVRELVDEIWRRK